MISAARKSRDNDAGAHSAARSWQCNRPDRQERRGSSGSMRFSGAAIQHREWRPLPPPSPNCAGGSTSPGSTAITLSHVLAATSATAGYRRYARRTSYRQVLTKSARCPDKVWPVCHSAKLLSSHRALRAGPDSLCRRAGLFHPPRFSRALVGGIEGRFLHRSCRRGADAPRSISSTRSMDAHQSKRPCDVREAGLLQPTSSRRWPPARSISAKLPGATSCSPMPVPLKPVPDWQISALPKTAAVAFIAWQPNADHACFNRPIHEAVAAETTRKPPASRSDQPNQFCARRDTPVRPPAAAIARARCDRRRLSDLRPQRTLRHNSIVTPITDLRLLNASKKPAERVANSVLRQQAISLTRIIHSGSYMRSGLLSAIRPGLLTFFSRYLLAPAGISLRSRELAAQVSLPMCDTCFSFKSPLRL